VKIYVASSWRNERQPGVVAALREDGHEVYDFRHPKDGDDGFHWSDIDPEWKTWEPREFRKALRHPTASDGLKTDMAGMKWAEVFVLVNPCGRSAHVELGWAIGAGKRTMILLDCGEPELMYGLADDICLSVYEVIGLLR